MRKTVKFAVSISSEEFEAMESIRKKSGLTRSALVRDALRDWREARRRDAAARAYVAGYRRLPEDPALAENLSIAASEALSGEDWS
jgi:metal-responsive CopG/Arc/MetJ family transcriptional regulator